MIRVTTSLPENYKFSSPLAAINCFLGEKGKVHLYLISIDLSPAMRNWTITHEKYGTKWHFLMPKILLLTAYILLLQICGLHLSNKL